MCYDFPVINIKHINMKEQRSISVPGINLEEDTDEENKDKAGCQPRPGSLFEVFMALKEKERY